MLMPGSLLGPYRIVSPLGKGGMGEVYRAKDERLGREVAVKILTEDLASRSEALKRFEREAKALASLSHPNIVTIHDVGTDQGIFYVVMELLEGASLRQTISKALPPVKEATEICIRIAEGLSAAHARGVIHRDLKPENVFLSLDGQVKILDFGLAKVEHATLADTLTSLPTETGITEPGKIMGTIAYASPEQLRGLPADARSDIFAFGCVLYETVLGKRPFQGATSLEVLAAILKETPEPPTSLNKDISTELNDIILCCLEKDPANRFETVREIIPALKASFQEAVSGSTAIARTRTISQPATARTAKAVRRTIDSIAVMPLVNATEDPELEYLTDGITETLINNFSQLPRLRVISRNKVFRYKGRECDTADLGRELNVRAVLMGRINQRGDQLTIKVELIDATDESQMWGEQYTRKLSDIFTLQMVIANQILERLHVKLTGKQKKDLNKRYTEDAEAYQHYLKGRYHWFNATPDSINKSMQHFQLAIESDPGFALPYAGLAFSYSMLGIYGMVSPKDAMPKAEGLANRAMQLGGTLPEAHAALAMVELYYNLDLRASEEQLEKAIKLNPNQPEFHMLYSFLCVGSSRFPEATQHAELARQADPLSPMPSFLIAATFYFQRQFDSAIDYCRRMIQMDTNAYSAYQMLGQSYAQKAMHEEAIRTLEKAREVSGESRFAVARHGHALAISGRKNEAFEIMAKMKETPGNELGIVWIYIGLGESDPALEWLEKAYQERDSQLLYLNVDPIYDPVRPDPRFADVLHRIRF